MQRGQGAGHLHLQGVVRRVNGHEDADCQCYAGDHARGAVGTRHAAAARVRKKCERQAPSSSRFVVTPRHTAAARLQMSAARQAAVLRSKHTLDAQRKQRLFAVKPAGCRSAQAEIGRYIGFDGNGHANDKFSQTCAGT